MDHAELSRLALEADPLASPAFATFLDGERKPNRPDAFGLLGGLTAATSRADLARAAHDGVLLALLRGEALMNEAGVATGRRVIVTGGGARSPAYRQILADPTGRAVEVADARDANEASARGAAVQAAAALSGRGVKAVRADWAPRFEVMATPRAGSAGLGAALLERYTALADWTGFDGRRGA